MASSSGRDRRSDALSRLRSEPAPWAPAVDLGVPADDDRTAPPEPAGETAPRDVDPRWAATPPPRWLDDDDVGAAQPDRSASLRRSSARRMPFVAPPAAIALIVVGVLACVVTAYSVLRGPSDDSPAAARVAFPASAGAAAPSSARPGESGGPRAAGPSRESSASSGARPPAVDELVVSVVGLVRTPGLVRLAGAARVADAIARAGGGRPGADLLSLNMAQPVRDGDQILVGFADPAGGAGMRSAIVSASSSGSGAPGSGSSEGAASAGAAPATTGAPGSASAADGAPVNLNTADEAALDTLPGVGPVTAKAIIDWRSRNGGFTSVDQLAEVDGIGPGRLAKLRDRVTV